MVDYDEIRIVKYFQKPGQPVQHIPIIDLKNDGKISVIASGMNNTYSKIGLDFKGKSEISLVVHHIGETTTSSTLTLGATGHYGGMPVQGESSGHLLVNDSNAIQRLNVNATHGTLIMRDKNDKAAFRVNTENHLLECANSQETTIFKVDAENSTVRVGPPSGIKGVKAGKFIVRNNEGNIIHSMDGETGNISTIGDIFLKNADCAEEFDISPSQLSQIEPGTVMVFDNNGTLEVSSTSYDKRVAGVISGAGNLKPAIVLDKKKSQNIRAPVAMLGKVFCKVDAEYSPINVGDMLTTSNTPGHAMKARNRRKIFGAVIGKALQSLNKSKGLIPILITLK